MTRPEAPRAHADLEAMAADLAANGQYRVLRRLGPHVAVDPAPGEVVRRGLFVDVETTGLDPVDALDGARRCGGATSSAGRARRRVCRTHRRARSDMTVFRTLLVLLWVALAAYTARVVAAHGLDLLPVFLGAIATGAWSGQFNTDFLCFLVLSAAWTAWCNAFSLMEGQQSR